MSAGGDAAKRLVKAVAGLVVAPESGAPPLLSAARVAALLDLAGLVTDDPDARCAGMAALGPAALALDHSVCGGEGCGCAANFAALRFLRAMLGASASPTPQDRARPHGGVRLAF